MTLLELARLYHNRVGGSTGYLEQLEVFVRRLDWQAKDLHPDRIDAYLTDALKHLAPSTVRNHRKMLRCLLHFAASERLVDASILRPLRRVKQIPPNPRAWSHAEIRSLLSVAANMTGGRKCPRNKLARAWILVAYSTGLRLDDLLSIRHDQIRGQRLCPSQHKVGWPHVCWLDDNALAAIRQLPILGPRIFGDLICRDKAMAMMNEHLEVMKQHVAAVKTFYAQLSPSQQKAFDALAPEMMHRHMMQMHEHMGMPGGMHGDMGPMGEHAPPPPPVH